MSGRVNVVLGDAIYETVKNLAEVERRSQSQMAAILIEEALLAREIKAKQNKPSSKA
ncbi:hypothetical protein CAL7716_058350 [Calothrix sp. PCC 7716]|nr:hypothetical protein CAL7716_058350 [Calothrix sp. PCC 7716]